MCGIAGIFVDEPARLDARTVAERMQIRLTHRGPDDHGLFVSDERRCALAHTRLSILDLSPAGHQPMGLIESEVGGRKSEVRHGQLARYWIVFNGEIYNYLQLREELGVRREARGGAGTEQGARGREEGEGTREAEKPTSDLGPLTSDLWRSNTDTEVILRAYARWGRECVNHLRGMFAFAIYDQETQELFLARDPLGIKPLYYCQTDHSFLFASEVRALLASDLVPRRLSQDGLASYLQYGSVQDPHTMIDGVYSLLPGRCLVVKPLGNRIESVELPFQGPAGSGSLSAYPFALGNPPSTRPEAVKLLREKLEESVRLHLASDVPLGAFLSGGIDSSAIVALMSRVADQKPKTFSVVFKESEYSEAEHAKVVAQQFGTEHREILLSEATLFDLLPSALEAMDQPTMDGINTYVVSKAVKEAGVTVALSGLGGDELFAGYPSFQRAMQLHRLGTVPFAIRRFASTAGRAFLNGSSRNKKLWDLVGSDCSPYAAYAISRQLFSPNEIAALMRVRGEGLEVKRSPDPLRLTPHDSCPSLHAPSSMHHEDIVNQVSWFELSGYMSNTLLRDTDQMSMAHALEVRVPFVDPEVVNYVLALPGEWKMNGGRPKPLLVDALGDLLPEEIWRRPKMGFTLPFQRWMKSALESEVNATLSGTELSSIGLSSDSAGVIWKSFKDNPRQQPWSRPWALYVLKKWCEINEVTVS